jgi:hypothetical protein
MDKQSKATRLLADIASRAGTCDTITTAPQRGLSLETREGQASAGLFPAAWMRPANPSHEGGAHA